MHNIQPYAEITKLLSLREKVGQVFMPAAFINDCEDEIRLLEKKISDYSLGGICFFHSRASAATNFEGEKEVVHNVNSYEKLCGLIKRYQKIAKYPLLIAIDAEWGLAMRIENAPQYPYNVTLGALSDQYLHLIEQVGKQIAKDCKVAGIHWNFAPCVDINSNPNNPVIGYRSFGADKNRVTQKSLAFLQGSQKEGILTSIKHFPGHGDTATDSHLGLPQIDKSFDKLLDNELYPFRKLIDQGIDSVMVGHLSVPALSEGERISSSISKKVIKGILREQMEFTGAVVSDALNMHAVSKNYTKKGHLEWLAFDAGNDMLCFAEHVEEGIETILKNATEHQIEESFQRIWKLKEKMKLSKKSNHVKLSDPLPLNKKIARASLTLFKGDKSQIPAFFASDFIGLSISRKPDNPFFDKIREHKTFECVPPSEIMAHKNKHLLLALFPPEVKPNNNFGISEKEFDLINKVLRNKEVIIYLFGNPYFLNKLDWQSASAIVLAYQDFKVFQEIAAAHYIGQFEAQGKLPITL